MAPVKRKGSGESESTRPEKKPKASAPSSKLSVPKNEEPDFPRGGASVLTPLEHKQIQIQATRDVLFEQTTGKKSTGNEFEDEENEADQPDHADGAPLKAKRKKGSKKGKSVELTEEAAVRIEGLSYKRLVPGSIVLGQVSQINRYDVALALPNNLTGYIPLTSISDTLAEKVAALVADDDATDEEDDVKDIDLKSFFSLGQYLRAYVTSTQDGAASVGKGRRHIELSVNPRQANMGLKNADVVVNSMIQASVLSVEDHGLVMNLGLEDTTIRGFMSSKEVGQNVDTSEIEDGAVFLCLVTGISSNGKTIKLSSDSQKAGNIKKTHFLIDAPTVDSFLPGTAVELLISDVTSSGITGKVMGMLNVTADLIHSGAAASGKDLEKKYNTGSKIKGRIICTFPTVERKKLGISILDHIVSLKSNSSTSKVTTDVIAPTQMLSISTVLEAVRVVKVEFGMGLFVDVGIKGVRGFVHISKVADGKVESLSESTGPYKLGSVHKARVIGYNSMDGLFIVSLEPKVIDQPFLRLEDVKVGQVVKGTVEKLMVNENGVNGVLVNIAEGITGLVPEVHLADIVLQHPERKFKEGSAVTARVLATLPEKRQLRLTLKKTLVNSDAEIWDSYEKLKPMLQAPGTLVNILPSGAVVQFYGSVRGFLPVSEMSESYIQDPKQHFRVGQVVNVHIISVDADGKRMMVSCKDPSVFGSSQHEALKHINPGAIVGGTVSQKTDDQIIVELKDSGLKGLLPFEHLADGSSQKCLSMAKKIRVNQILNQLVVINKSDSKRLVQLTSKPSLVKDAIDGKILKSFDDVVEGTEVHGYVNNITPTGIFVQFAANTTGLLLKAHIPEEAIPLPDFGMRRNQSISARILSVDHGQQRFLLTLKPIAEKDPTIKPDLAESCLPGRALSNPIDNVSTSLDDYTIGKLTKAKVTSVKQTQMNIQLADGVQGRIDVSEVFDSWEDIKDPKYPLKAFHRSQILPVRILGMHDSRNHRFLPITHRGKAHVFELTAKPSEQSEADSEILTLDKVEVGSTRIVFVNNISDNCIWVNISPNVRGRIRAIDVSDDVSLLEDLSKSFPIGSALRAKVTSIDITSNRLDLSARFGSASTPLTLNDVSKGMVLPGRVTKVTEHHVIVQVSDELCGPIHLTDLADDYAKVDPTAYHKNQIVRVCVKDVDASNQRLHLSMRPSKVLSSSLPVEDPEIYSISQLKVNDILRGFIKNVTDTGVFVDLGTNITAYIRVSDLSDLFLKDWKSNFEIHQLVKGKIIAVDPALSHIQMSLKQSQVDKDYQAPLTFFDVTVGKVVTGKVRKVEAYGVFIVVDGSANVSGLCHRSEMADRKAPNPKALYNEGDAVQAKVLKIDQTKKQISFGLKASYFGSESEPSVRLGVKSKETSDSDDDSDEEMAGMNGVEVKGIGEEQELSNKQGLESRNVRDLESDVEMENGHDSGAAVTTENVETSRPEDSGLRTGGFDWTGGFSASEDTDTQSETDEEPSLPKKRRRKAEIKIDRTGDLDANGPQSVADFERILMGQPNSSVLWLSYMAFQLQLSEVTKAREIAERAIRTINLREETEKMNVWVALLNLENTYGNDESLEEVFQRACQYNDSQEIHERLISIHIQSGNNKKADALFQTALRKHSHSPALYLNHATFLLTTLPYPDRARALLPRALQSLPAHTHLALTKDFGLLEFNTPHGDPERGRTIFEGLLATFPKRLDLWNVLLDAELRRGETARARALLERVTMRKLKGRQAKFFFKRWLELEEKHGDERSRARVTAKAAEYVRVHKGDGEAAVD